MKSSKNSQHVSASEAGRAAFCAHYLELDRKGHKPSKQAQELRARGDKAHDKLNQESEDKRCYVASYLYGADDPRTMDLRLFRDTYLLKTKFGHGLVGVYYFISPLAVSLAQRIPVVDIILKYLVSRVHRRWIRKNNDD